MSHLFWIFSLAWTPSDSVLGENLKVLLPLAFFEAEYVFLAKSRDSVPFALLQSMMVVLMRLVACNRDFWSSSRDSGRGMRGL